MKHTVVVIVRFEFELLTIHVFIQAVDAHVFVIEKDFDKITAHVVARCLGLIRGVIRCGGKRCPDVFCDAVANTSEINLPGIQPPVKITAQAKKRHFLLAAVLVVELQMKIMLLAIGLSC